MKDLRSWQSCSQARWMSPWLVSGSIAYLEMDKVLPGELQPVELLPLWQQGLLGVDFWGTAKT